jgi:hypothetical protein
MTSDLIKLKSLYSGKWKVSRKDFGFYYVYDSKTGTALLRTAFRKIAKALADMGNKT